jgi:hypothetical protein
VHAWSAVCEVIWDLRQHKDVQSLPNVEQLSQDRLEGPEPLGWKDALAKVSEKHPERCPICAKQLLYSGVIPRKRQGEAPSFRDFEKLIQPVGMPVAA